MPPHKTVSIELPRNVLSNFANDMDIIVRLVFRIAHKDMGLIKVCLQGTKTKLLTFNF